MDTGKAEIKVIDPVDFMPMTMEGILLKEFALKLVSRYKEVNAPRFAPAMKVMMFASYAKDCPNKWSDIDVTLIVPKVDKENWWDLSKASAMMSTRSASTSNTSSWRTERIHPFIAR